MTIGMALPTVGSRFIRRGEIWRCIAIGTVQDVCNEMLEMDEEEIQDVIAEFGAETTMYVLRSEKYGHRVGVTKEKIDSDLIWFN